MASFQMSSLIAVLVVSTACAAHLRTASQKQGIEFEASVASQFAQYTTRHKRTYTGAEYDMRLRIFQKRMATIVEKNSRPDRTYLSGVNKFTDRTDSELQAYRGLDRSARSTRSSSSSSVFLEWASSTASEEQETDYSYLASSRYVRDQGSCGSCWAIATATVLSAHYEIKNNASRVFSSQEILSCTPNPDQCGGEGQCKGATAELAMEWVLKNGCSAESELPYSGVDGKCEVNSDAPAKKTAFMDYNEFGASSIEQRTGSSVGLISWTRLPLNEGDKLKAALLTSGPVAVSVAGSAWFPYESGVFNDCPKDAIVDHAVAFVAYGGGALKIQNSWGAEWGENGFIRLMDKADREYCGMDNKPELGTACKGDTAPVEVCGMCGVYFDSVIPTFQKMGSY